MNQPIHHVTIYTLGSVLSFLLSQATAQSLASSNLGARTCARKLLAGGREGSCLPVLAFLSSEPLLSLLPPVRSMRVTSQHTPMRRRW